MKRILLCLTFAVLLAFPLSGRALLDDSQIQSVIRINSETCAIEIENLGSPLDLSLLDRISVGNTVLAGLSQLKDLLDGVLEQVDQALLATESFAALTGIDPDIVLEVEDCAHLETGATVNLQNALGVVDSLELPGDFGDLTAVVRTVTGLLEVIDLNIEELPVGNSDGEDAPIGGGAGGVGGEDNDGLGDDSGNDGGEVGKLPAAGAAGGCSQTGLSMFPGRGGLGWMGLLVTLVVLGWQRRSVGLD